MLSFAITVFLSAFLLFQIQPIIAKMILPWFGGSSSVWSTCLVFFQAELLLGYLYVHLLHELLSPRRQNIVHCVLLILSAATLPVIANPAWRDAAFSSPTWNVLVVLAAAVGMPYLLLSTTGPLMQAWYARTFTSVMPYRLYALSNLASMIALLSYPVLVEPYFPVHDQAMAWSAAYVLFIVACLASARLSWQGVPAEQRERTPARSETVPRPPLSECLLWIGLAMTASLLLLAMTRHLTQDVAPVPFLWVLPLSIYLLSFILCFDAPRYYYRPGFLVALPVALFAVDRVLDGGMDVPMLVTLMCLSLFVFCMVCHGELVRRRPAVRHLTLFYLMLSIGGALGGSFVGLLAPVIFNAYFELPIGLFLCAALVIVVLWRELQPRWRVLLLAALLAYGYRLGGIAVAYVEDYRLVQRNFYGQVRIADVSDDELGVKRKMFHGRVNHGEQFLSPEYRRQPTAYYCHESGIGQALHSLAGGKPLHIGILGLGTGTLAAYGRAGDEMRMYEINDQVVDLARSEFSYLADSAATIVPVLGDGRLMLEREPPQNFDVLAIDAFSGDSIPTHLLTLEAMRAYQRHMKSDGLLALHITNRYLDLRPVVAAAAAELGMSALIFDFDPPDGDRFCRHSVWVLLASPERAAQLPEALRSAEKLTPRPGFTPWTDSFSNLLGILQ
ncbi:fused MFS/spermidine synthase [Candidatus Accumulibacter sp. ACC003]|uniref:fused MFS/spermidine synthase n=1 Tax=Candidatus Accumulibacter sp. ACC003 TaxID=2823334 RepID=UPI0025C56CE3|nr:fused MFS/spermidine synthase [Candidatus Accumulibacter sp. ACC003]